MDKFLEVLEALEKKLSKFVEQKDKDIDALKKEVKSLEKQVLELLASQRQVVKDRDPYVAFTDAEADLAKGFVELAQAIFSQDLNKIKAMTEQTDSEGGYLVPEEFRATLVRLIETYGEARKMATVIPMTRDELRIPSLVSGVTVYWVGEGQNITQSQPTFDRVNMVAKKMAALVPVTAELLEDASISIANLLANLFAEAMAAEEDRVAFTGNPGAGDPFSGVMYTSGVNIVEIGGANFSDLTADDLLTLTSAVPSPAAKRGVFVLNRTVFDQIRKLKDNNGNYIWQSPSAAAPGTIWGYPYVLSDVMPSMSDSAANTPFVIFGDFRQLYFGDRRRMSMSQSSHVGFIQDLTYIKATQRLAIAVAIPRAFAVAKTAAS